MYDFTNANIPVTKNEILSKISEYDIFKRYCSNFRELNISFCSELRVDNNPSCKIYLNNNNDLIYKDFGNGDHFNCWYYICAKYSCDFISSINIVAADFGFSKGDISLNPQILVSNDEFKLRANNTPKVKSNIQIVSQPFNLVDYNYWNQYGISLELLQEYNVFSAKFVYLFKGDKRYIYEYKKTCPIFAYRFTREGDYSYKIYKPLAEKKYKWLFSGGAESDIEGYDNLPLHGDILILTKSLKDCMCYNVLGYPAISLQGETNRLSQDLVYKLLKRFNKIIIQYDNDVEGRRGTERLKNQYGFKSFFIDEEKDLSDYIKRFGVDTAKIIVDEKIKSIICLYSK